MNIETWVLILVPSVVVCASILVLVLAYVRRNPAKSEENVEMLANVEKSLKEGKISEQDAEVIRKSVNG